MNGTILINVAQFNVFCIFTTLSRQVVMDFSRNKIFNMANFSIFKVPMKRIFSLAICDWKIKKSKNLY